jgi:hypothetical protein
VSDDNPIGPGYGFGGYGAEKRKRPAKPPVSAPTGARERIEELFALQDAERRPIADWEFDRLNREGFTAEAFDDYCLLGKALNELKWLRHYLDATRDQLRAAIAGAAPGGKEGGARWTRTVPAEPGFYWRRSAGGTDIVKVAGYDLTDMAQIYEPARWEWSGPLAAPADAEATDGE